MRGVDVRLVREDDELENAMRIRQLVFTEEQGIPAELDQDGLDDEATHLVAITEGIVVGTTRVRMLDPKTAKVQRVAVMRIFRRRGLGAELMNLAEIWAKSQNRDPVKVTLEAEISAQHFYEELGYISEGEVFQMAGIDHIKMSKLLV